MTIQRSDGDSAKVALVIYTLLFWVSGLALLFIGLWILLDPKQNYILYLLNSVDEHPLLTMAAHIAILAGALSLFVGFIGCCGALKRMRCLLVSFMICLFFLFLADITIGILALVYRSKLSSADSNFGENLKSLLSFSYGVSMEIDSNRQVTAMIDKLQFYEECCGVVSGDDYLASRWMASVASDPAYEHDDPPLVPTSCCRQINGASALNPVARSMARCQQPTPNKMWRHTSGCHEKLLEWLDEQTRVFAIVGFSFAALMVIGMVISLVRCKSVKYYKFVRDED
ncbi:hypothetical protein V3C99_012547 [Haemonchus contortus]